MTKRRIHSEPRQYWTAAQDNQLRNLYPHAQTADVARAINRSVQATYARAAKFGLRKSDEYLRSPAAHRLDGLKGMGTRFQKGNVSWNKGTHFTAGGRSAETRFRKGDVSKRWNPDFYTVGALRINSDGGLDIKVKEGLRAWECFARYVWRTEVGPIPKGGVVRAINGDPHDTRIENLRLTTRGELMRENTYHNYPKEIVRAIQLRGAIVRQINRREREKQDRGSAQSPVRNAGGAQG